MMNQFEILVMAAQPLEQIVRGDDLGKGVLVQVTPFFVIAEGVAYDHQMRSARQQRRNQIGADKPAAACD